MEGPWYVNVYARKILRVCTKIRCGMHLRLCKLLVCDMLHSSRCRIHFKRVRNKARA